MKTSLWITVGLVVAREIPNDKCFVATSRKEHVWADAMSVTTGFAQMSSPYFSRDVAKLVTQPLWPSRVPRCTNCSVILGNWEVWRHVDICLSDCKPDADNN